MADNLTELPSRKRLERYVETGIRHGYSPSDLQALAAFALAVMDVEPVAWDYEWASYITCEGPQGFKRVIEREAPPKWAIDEGQARNITPLYRQQHQKSK